MCVTFLNRDFALTDDPSPGFQQTRARSPRSFRTGARESFGVPALVLGASFLGFGALARGADIALGTALVSVPLIWALPGQVVMVEMYATGAQALAIIIAVSLSGARFLPMTLALMPLMREGSATQPAGPKRWLLFLAGQFVAITGWAAAMKRFPEMDPVDRLPYFAGFTLVLVTSASSATVIGYLLAASVPEPVTLGLIFVNPIYFMMVFVADVRRRPFVLALIIGALSGPMIYQVTPEWSLLATGLIAGSVAFAADLVISRMRRAGEREE